jgi:ABC-type multidrug transport system fused ATPase/permease subunit
MSDSPVIPPRALARNGALVWRYLSPRLPSLAAASLMALVLGMVGAAIPLLFGPAVKLLGAERTEVLQLATLFGKPLGSIVPRIVGRSSMTAGDLLLLVPAALAVLALVRGACGMGQWFLFERAGERAALDARRDLMATYLRSDPAYRRTPDGREREAELSSGVTSDIRMMREYIVHFYGGLPREVAQIVFTAFALVKLSPKMFAIFALGVGPAGIVVSRLGKKLRKRAGRALSDYSLLSEWLQQRLLGIETIKHYRTEAIEAAKMEELSAGLLQRFLGAARVKARTSPMLETFAVAAMAAVLLVALSDVAAGRIEGQIVLSFFATLAVLSQSAGRLGRYLNSNREGAAAVDRLRRVLTAFGGHRRETVVPQASPAAPDGTAAAVCEEITVRYPGTVEPALADFSFTFHGGRVYCLAGPSGAGKSTLFNVLLGLVVPGGGRITLHGAVPPGGQPIVYMPQKVLLVPGSVRANVMYPKDPTAVGEAGETGEVDAERVRAALARVGLTETVAGLPRGVDTVVGEGGVGLSGGQAQRVLLARLWYHRAPVVLVDEGTSALDPEVELLAHALLRDLAAAGAVLVTIAHRPGVAEAADELLLLSRGRLAAHGAPREVMASAAYKSALH